MKHLLTWSVLTALLFATITELSAQLEPPKTGPFNVALYQGAQWRNIGPYRGGRSVTAAGVPGNDQVYYMGTTGGGVWKTIDAGLSWKNISDGYFNVGSIGAIAVASSDPNVIYVGTGEHAIRGVMTSHGDGVYKSTDAGKSWTYLGLEKSRHIADIQIHPDNPDHLYVAVQGAAHGPTVDRGIYRSLDGGKSWEHLFFINESTGAADLSMDPTNPRILYAGMWDHERKPWQIRSGGEGSGIFRSSDGGENWHKLQNGLPAQMGKVGVVVSPANPQTIYANIEAEKGGVFRSRDGGDNWVQVNDQRLTIGRAWYYTEIVADPTDEHTVYVLNAPLLRSMDGGRTFENVPNPHTDQHDLWINPDAPTNMILANDGGACISFNGGRSWSPQNNQPTGQFYRAIADQRFPFYHIYGGQQDNSAIAIASRSPRSGISEKDWYQVAGGESAFIAFDPSNPELVYGGSFQGNISVFDHQTEEVKDVMAYPTVGLATLPRDMKYRFNWNAPIVASPQDPRVIFHAAQKVLRTRNGGISWQEISPDLTRNEKEKQGPGGAPFTNEGAGGENYNTISYLACSPHDSWVMWVGSDDGLVHVTRDEGQSWQNVTPPDLEECLINSIEVSPHNPATAYVVASKYRFNDFAPMIYRTEDFGTTWTKVTRGIAPEDFVRVVREDPLREGLLYAGTETGLYVSYSSGKFWHRFQLNLPVCPISDLTIQGNDLIAATAGRGFWILDDLGFLQQSAGYLLARDPQVFRPKPTYRLAGNGGAAPAGEGQNAPAGMVIDYYLPPQLDTALAQLEVLNSDGELVRRFSSLADKDHRSYVGGPSAQPLLPNGYGIRRFCWDLRREPIRHIDGIFVLGSYQGALVPPGDYTLRLLVGNKEFEERAQILADPRLQANRTDYAEQQAFLTKIERTVADIHGSVEMMQDLHAQMQVLADRLDKLEDQPQLVGKARSIMEQIDTWQQQLVQPDQETFQDVINFPNRLNAELLNLHSRCDGADPRMTQGAQERLTDLETAWLALAEERDLIIYNEMEDFNKLYSEQQLPALFLPNSTDGTAW
ncbi:MAG: glycosyl hydrolase [Bacteroidota bacterium]